MRDGGPGEVLFTLVSSAGGPNDCSGEKSSLSCSSGSRGDGGMSDFEVYTTISVFNSLFSWTDFSSLSGASFPPRET